MLSPPFTPSVSSTVDVSDHMHRSLAQASLSKLDSCVQMLINITTWMSQRYFQFNMSKTHGFSPGKRRRPEKRERKGKEGGGGRGRKEQTSKPCFLCSVPVTMDMTPFLPVPQATHQGILLNTFFSPHQDSNQSPALSLLPPKCLHFCLYSISLVPEVR